ncbi:MAG: imidazoleglycerol-phosphate dehydratase HisB [Lentisphaerae bacterium]|nr:imidazoleglycerol-phosphate dehydratase HisB [Lentisphaerota bacterium]
MNRKRSAVVHRKTRETDIRISLDIDGTGSCSASTGMPFMDHMIELLARHSLFDLTLRARGDLQVDYHHTVEDIGLALGTALDKALGTRRGIHRYGWCMAAMDESLGRAAVDLGGRPYLVYEIANRRRKILEFDLGLIEEFFRAFVVQGRMNLHVAHMYGSEPHHAYESVFKAAARALRMACALDPREKGLPSSKGKI